MTNRLENDVHEIEKDLKSCAKSLALIASMMRADRKEKQNELTIYEEKQKKALEEIMQILANSEDDGK